jgi:pilus assembly protein FimV
MSRRLFRLSFVLGLLLAGEAGAIGLGDIRLDSALNEPLRAEIELLSATPEELAALQISLAPREIFDRYGIDRPVFLQSMEFDVVATPTGGASVLLSTPGPITEPFLTFLVEASCSAPTQSAPSDSGRIEREPTPVRDEPPPRPLPEPVSAPPQAQPQPAAEVRQYDTTAGGDYVVQRRETLWGIAQRMRPDSRLTMNQTMLAIYEANPGAFGGNINLLKAGATLRIPSADEIFRISRGDALSEVRRQNTNWQDGTSSAYVPPRTESRPSLTLVPPDDEPVEVGYDDDVEPAEPLTREQQIENRIAELEGADVPQQQSLIEIRDNELASLRQELANIRGEVYEPPAAAVEDDPFVEEPADAIEPTDAAVDEAVTDEAPAAEADEPTDVVTTAERTPRVSQPTFIERIIGVISKFWAAILGGLVIIGGLLFWRMRGSDDEVGDAGPFQPLDADDRRGGVAGDDEMASTKTIPAPSRDDDSIMVIEEDSGIRPMSDDTAEMPLMDAGVDAEATAEIAEVQDGDTFGSLEDTFSSDTAINLDQTDPIAEADFHMAYGLYDQAADLINGALETDPEDRGLISKLCEIYFVWGNRDLFVDAAGRLKTTLGEEGSAEWDKIVIMGQQIAADDPLFADAGLTAATQMVDLSFESDSDDVAELDMDFGIDSGGESDIIDLGADDDSATESGVIDFSFDEADNDDDVDVEVEPTEEMPGIDATNEMETVEIAAQDSEETVETPTVESPAVEDEGGTTELPSLAMSLDDADTDFDAGETAEINLDDLDLGLDELAETELASLDDLDETGRNTEVDLEAMIGPDEASEMNLARDETGTTPALQAEDEETDIDIDIDADLLDKTGITQILEEGVEEESGDADVEELLSDDDETMQTPRTEDEFDFAKTEALPDGTFEAISDVEETGEMQAVAETDLDLDLDDLTAALKVTEVGDAEEFIEVEDTAEQPRPDPSDTSVTAEMPTMSMAPEGMGDDLQDARTMTEVGTKLDLARAYVDMGDPAGARSILEEVLEEGDEGQRQQAQQLLDTLPG